MGSVVSIFFFQAPGKVSQFLGFLLYVFDFSILMRAQNQYHNESEHNPQPWSNCEIMTLPVNIKKTGPEEHSHFFEYTISKVYTQ